MGYNRHIVMKKAILFLALFLSLGWAADAANLFDNLPKLAAKTFHQPAKVTAADDVETARATLNDLIKAIKDFLDDNSEFLPSTNIMQLTNAQSIAQGVYNNSSATLQQLNDAIALCNTALEQAYPQAFEGFRQVTLWQLQMTIQKVGELSEPCQQLVGNVTNTLNAATYDPSLSFEVNILNFQTAWMPYAFQAEALGCFEEPEMYAVLEGTKMVLYFDKLKKSHADNVLEVWNDYNGCYHFDETVRNKITAVELDETMKAARPKGTRYWFYRLPKLTEIIHLDYLNTQEVTEMYEMFEDCSSLTTLNLSTFNTENVTEMSLMFYGCSSLTTLNLSNFNTAKLEKMFSMFYGCSSLTALDVSNFNIDKVSDMRQMFANCTALKTIYCDNDWSSNHFASSDMMFLGCTSLVGGKGTTYNETKTDKTYALPDGLNGNPGYFTSIENYPVYVYSVFSSNTLTFYCDNKMYSHSGITEIYDPETVTTIKRFEGYNEMVTNAVMDPSMENAKLTSLHNLFLSEVGEYFANMPELTTITGLEYLNTENVTDMSDMFAGCWKLTSPLDLSNFNTSNVTNMNSMFGGCGELLQLDLTAFDVSKVTEMESMFSGCKKLTTIYCGEDWTKGSVTRSAGIFGNCKKLKGDKGTNWTAANPQDITYARPDGGTDAPGYFSKKTPTAIDQLTDEQQQMTNKILRNGQILILRNGILYTITGAEVR